MTAAVPIQPGVAWGFVLGRGGSKGIPGKNLRDLGGHPLVAWAVAAGRAATSVDRVICSTDDDAIAEAARTAGAEVPFRRPAFCAGDAATDLDVFRHALEWFSTSEGALPEFLVHLRPTTPFRRPDWIDAALGRMRTEPQITALRSVTPSPLSPYKMWRRDASGSLVPAMTLAGVEEPFNMPRQALPEVLWHTGQLDVIRTTTVLAGSMTGDHVHALDVDAEMAIDIDTPADLEFARLRFEAIMPTPLRAMLAA